MGDRSGLWQLPLYLFFASIANVLFLVRAVSDLKAKRREKAPAIALVALAIAELTWAVPCFLQCLMTLISDKGDNWWVPSNSDIGCNIMGFYSVFASVTGQILVTQIAAYSYYSVNLGSPAWSPTMIIRSSAAAFTASVMYCLLPFVGVGSYTESGEGFCYIDWSDPKLVVLMELVTIPCMILVLFFTGALFFHGNVTKGYAPIKGYGNRAQQWFWCAAALSYVSAWFLWMPAAFIGLGSSEPYPDMFPEGYMISGGVLGHAQAILNPLLYGTFWRGWFVLCEGDDYESIPPDAKKGSDVELA